MRESDVMGNYHASFGERDGETRPVRIVKGRTVPPPLSPGLANMTLDGLERILRKKYPHAGPKALQGRNTPVNLVRYCDDCILTGIAKATLETAVTPLVTAFLRERGLERSEE